MLLCAPSHNHQITARGMNALHKVNMNYLHMQPFILCQVLNYDHQYNHHNHYHTHQNHSNNYNNNSNDDDNNDNNNDNNLLF